MDSSRALAAGPRGSLCVLCWFIRSHLRSGSILACSLASRLTNSSQLLVATLVVLQADSIVLCRSCSLLGLCVESYCPSHRLNLDTCSAHRRSLVPCESGVSAGGHASPLREHFSPAQPVHIAPNVPQLYKGTASDGGAHAPFKNHTQLSSLKWCSQVAFTPSSVRQCSFDMSCIL